MNHRISGVCAAVAAVVFCAACGGEGMDESNGAVESAGARIVLEDRYSENGVLTVAEDATGILHIGIQGRIGIDDDQVGAAAFSLDTLENTYLALHPEATEAPAIVRELSSRLQVQRALHVAPLDVEVGRGPIELPTSLQDKDQAGFNATACQTFHGSFEYWWPFFCGWGIYHSVGTTASVNSSWPKNDRSAAWNETPYSAKHSLLGMAWQPTVPAWTWYVHEWGGSYTNRIAFLTLNGSGTVGSLGITDHNYVADPH